ncbi:MAG: acyltransferase [Alphaproteobacteria bacterium]|nr:acyltransferase [Alphaproteobacteria bacterium]
MANSQANHIDYTFKMLYIIAIIMVVDGHIGNFDYLNLNGLLRYQNYHLALFMFTSGYFLNLNKNYQEFIASKFTKLIVPLYIWNLIYGFLCYILNNHFGFNLGGDFNLYNILYAPLTDGHQFIYNMASWFLIPLFILQIISFIILKPIPSSKLSLSSIIFFIIATTLACFTVPLIQQNQGNRNIALLFYRTLYFLPSFSLGFLYRHFLKKYDTLNTPLYLFIILSLITLLCVNFPNYNHIPAWLDALYEPMIVIYLISFLAILFWLRIAKTLSFLAKESKSLNYISNHTFDIMMHHFVGFMLIKAMLSPFGNNFDMYAFKHNIWYYHFPIDESLCAWLYIFITIVITLLIVFTINHFYDKIKKILSN